MIDIRKLREIAPKLKEPIRSLLLSEPENMTVEEYVAKVTDWLKLLELVEKQ
jgi:DNA-directed RNA polymerase subunit F